MTLMLIMKNLTVKICLQEESPHEAAKLYGLCLDHYGILKNITKDATILQIAKSACHLSSECDVFKVWKMGDKIYTECEVSGTKVSG